MTEDDAAAFSSAISTSRTPRARRAFVSTGWPVWQAFQAEIGPTAQSDSCHSGSVLITSSRLSVNFALNNPPDHRHRLIRKDITTILLQVGRHHAFPHLFL